MPSGFMYESEARCLVRAGALYPAAFALGATRCYLVPPATRWAGDAWYSQHVAPRAKREQGVEPQPTSAPCTNPGSMWPPCAQWRGTMFFPPPTPVPLDEPPMALSHNPPLPHSLLHNRGLNLHPPPSYSTYLSPSTDLSAGRCATCCWVAFL